MKNIALYKELINGYEKVAFTDNYIWGFAYKGNIYMAITKSDYIETVCKLDKASRGAGYSLRFKPTMAQKEALLTKASLLCSEKFFKEEFDKSKYNRGETFERLVTEAYGQEWEKDSVPFTEAGDLEVEGIAYQIKFQGATFCSEKSLKNLIKR